MDRDIRFVVEVPSRLSGSRIEPARGLKSAVKFARSASRQSGKAHVLMIERCVDESDVEVDVARSNVLFVNGRRRGGFEEIAAWGGDGSSA